MNEKELNGTVTEEANKETVVTEQGIEVPAGVVVNAEPAPETVPEASNGKKRGVKNWGKVVIVKVEDVSDYDVPVGLKEVWVQVCAEQEFVSIAEAESFLEQALKDDVLSGGKYMILRQTKIINYQVELIRKVQRSEG